MANKAKQKGFTLIELIVVVALIGILAAIAVPNFLTWLPNMRLKAAASNLRSNMQKVKMEAIKRNENVVVLINDVNCPGLPNTVPTPGGGYQLFVDDGSGAGGIAGNNILDGTELNLATVAMPANSALCTTSFAPARTGFNPKGLVLGNNGTITLNNDQNRSYTLTLTIAGGIRLQ